MSWYLAVLKNYVGFSGRARRKEYWYFFLFNFLISIALTFVDTAMGGGGQNIGILSSIYALAVFLPALAVSIRRLHDTDRTGWWILIAFVPLIGFIVLLVFFCLEGTPGNNSYGADPLAQPD